MKPELTAQQKKVMDFLADYLACNKHTPTLQEIADNIDNLDGYPMTPQGAREHLIALEKKGYVDRKWYMREMKINL